MKRCWRLPLICIFTVSAGFLSACQDTRVIGHSPSTVLPNLSRLGARPADEIPASDDKEVTNRLVSNLVACEGNMTEEFAQLSSTYNRYLRQSEKLSLVDDLVAVPGANGKPCTPLVETLNSWIKNEPLGDLMQSHITQISQQNIDDIFELLRENPHAVLSAAYVWSRVTDANTVHMQEIPADLKNGSLSALPQGDWVLVEGQIKSKTGVVVMKTPVLRDSLADLSTSRLRYLTDGRAATVHQVMGPNGQRQFVTNNSDNQQQIELISRQDPSGVLKTVAISRAVSHLERAQTDSNALQASPPTTNVFDFCGASQIGAMLQRQAHIDVQAAQKLVQTQQAAAQVDALRSVLSTPDQDWLDKHASLVQQCAQKTYSDLNIKQDLDPQGAILTITQHILGTKPAIPPAATQPQQ